MKITTETIEYVAHLARLELNNDEIELYTNQLNNILDYMDVLNSLDTRDIEPTTHPMPLICVMREDTVRPSFTKEASIQNAPDRTGSFFRVPPIIEIEG